MSEIKAFKKRGTCIEKSNSHQFFNLSNKTKTQLRQFTSSLVQVIFEQLHEKTNNLALRPGPTQSQKQVRSLKFWMKKKSDCTIHEVKTKVVILVNIKHKYCIPC